MKSTLNIHWKDWCWSWSSNTLATWCKELTYWKRHWCWERLKAAGEGDDRGWDGWLVSPIRWTWVWASSGNWWWTGNPGMLWDHKESDTTEWLNWTDGSFIPSLKGIFIVFSIVVASVCIPTNIIRGFPFLYTDPSTDEWIRKLWYIYTMEFYSAIRRNTFESVLMGWMNLEPIIQREVSQKEKDKYHIY